MGNQVRISETSEFVGGIDLLFLPFPLEKNMMNYAERSYFLDCRLIFFSMLLQFLIGLNTVTEKPKVFGKKCWFKYIWQSRTMERLTPQKRFEFLPFLTKSNHDYLCLIS